MNAEDVRSMPCSASAPNRKCIRCKGKYERIQRCLVCMIHFGTGVWTPATKRTRKKRQPTQNGEVSDTAQSGASNTSR